MAAYKALIIDERRRTMKKGYATPKAELMDFDYTETVVASNFSGLTDLGAPGTTSAGGWTCQERIVDIKSIDGTVCGYVQH